MNVTDPDVPQQISVQRVSSLPNPLALAHFLYTTPALSTQGFLVVVQNPIEAEILLEGLQKFTPLSSVQQRIWWKGERFLLPLLRTPVQIITDKETLESTPLPSPNSFRQQVLQLAPGDTFPLQQLKKFLTTHGYERDSSANAQGKWAARGDSIDVHAYEPIRIIYTHDTIESLFTFDLATGKQQKSLEQLILPSIQAKGRSSLIDHLPKEKSLFLFHQEPLPSEHQQYVIDPLTSAGSLNAGYTECRSYHLRYKEMIADAQSATQVIIYTKNRKKIEAIFADALHRTEPPIDIIESETLAHTHGWRLHTTELVVFTDQSLGIEEQEVQRATQRMQQAMIQTLKPGDYVVHLFHGIGRFTGMTTMHVNQMDREYFVLEYAEKDKMYVPVELSERIEKYIGGSDPSLHRLSGAGWYEVVQRVKVQAMQMANELLQLYARRDVSKAPELTPHTEEVALDVECPFELTEDQRHAVQDVYNDMEKEKPMDRLLCGDVGFGKTEVAIRAAFRAVLNGYQVVLLAPTTILTQQHTDTFQERLKNFGVQVHTLSRFQTEQEQGATIKGLRVGTVDIVIGTHRLFSKDIQFKKLGLIIIDEEQRFGVRAKETLKKLRKEAHVLSMTATPIPRTLHLSLSGIRDISTILTPPEQRKSVETTIQRLTPETIQQAIEREMERNGQTYYIYNRVQSIAYRKNELQQLLPKARIGIAHGQMKAQELASVMHEFDVGNIDILLTTTIVENGLDIPRANTLIVENASLFGLAELYQLKGRVGRSHHQGYAYFLYKEQELESDVKKRFIALQETQALGSGFELAMKDMEIRGVGNILGREQHGHAIKIGLNFYIRLLQQAVQELEGVETEPERDIPIDLPIETRIPESMISQEEDRIVLYQQLASIRSVEELQKKRDQYSNPPSSFAALFDFLEIKLLTMHSPLLSIETLYPSKSNTLRSPRITLSSEKPFSSLPNVWEQAFNIKGEYHKAFVTVEELGENWIQQLKEVITQIAEQ